MYKKIPPGIILSSEVSRAAKYQQPIVALESAVITHGLPHPRNYELAIDIENEIREQKVVPATIALISGKIHAGLNKEQLKYLASYLDLDTVPIDYFHDSSRFFAGHSR